MLRFFVDAEGGLREISRKWDPPKLAGSAPEAAAQRLERSVETCIAGLLQQLQLEPGQASAESRPPLHGGSKPAESEFDPQLRSAIRAAVLRAQQDTGLHKAAPAAEEEKGSSAFRG